MRRPQGARSIACAAVGLSLLAGFSACRHRDRRPAIVRVERAVGDGGRCTLDSVALAAGFCRVRVQEWADVQTLPSWIVATLKCGERRMLCSEPFECACDERVVPFPCEPDRAEHVLADGTYTHAQFQEAMKQLRRGEDGGPSYQSLAIDGGVPFPGMFTHGIVAGALGEFDTCAMRVFEPQYGGCFTEGALSSDAGIAHFSDWIPYRETRQICGRAWTCGCGVSRTDGGAPRTDGGARERG